MSFVGGGCVEGGVLEKGGSAANVAIGVVLFCCGVAIACCCCLRLLCLLALCSSASLFGFWFPKNGAMGLAMGSNVPSSTM